MLEIILHFSIVYLVLRYVLAAVEWVVTPRGLSWELHPIEHGFWRLLSDAITFQQYKNHHNKKYRGVLIAWHLSLIGSIIYHGLALLFVEMPRLLAAFIYLNGIVSTLLLIRLKASDPLLKSSFNPKNIMLYAILIGYFITGLLTTSPEEYSEIHAVWQSWWTTGSYSMTLIGMSHIIATTTLFWFLPETKAFHYITRFFAFYFVVWRHRPASLTERLQLQATLTEIPEWEADQFKIGGTKSRETWAAQVKKTPQMMEREDE